MLPTGSFRERIGFLPIVERELRVTARRPGFYLARVILALGALAVGGLVYFGNYGNSQVLAGRFIFWCLAGAGTLFALFAGGNYTADTLSVEKREGTLGLLFLTDLKGFDVVMGKLASSSLASIYTLFAGFPIMAIPLLMGGVTAGEFWRMALVVVNTFTFSMAAGMLGSALHRNARSAGSTASFLIMVPSIILPGVGGALAVQAAVRGPVDHGWLLASPGYTFYAALDLNYRFERNYFWCAMALVQGLAWVWLALASWIVPHSWQDRPAKTGRPGWRPWRHWWQQQRFGRPEQRAALLKELLDRNPYLWLMARNRWKRRRMWVLPGTMVGFTLTVLLMAGRDWQPWTVLMLMSFGANFVLKFWITAETCEQLRQDRESGALEMLFSTALTPRDVLKGVRLAVRRQLWYPLAAALLIVWCLVAVCCFAIPDEADFSRPALMVMALAMTAMLFVDLATIVHVGTFNALTVKNPRYAAGRTALCLLVLPWAAFWIIGTLAAMAAALSRSQWELGWATGLSMWVVLGLAVDLTYGLRARKRLLSGEVRLPTQRHAPRALEAPK